jgi:hypothetical protein
MVEKMKFVVGVGLVLSLSVALTACNRDAGLSQNETNGATLKTQAMDPSEPSSDAAVNPPVPSSSQRPQPPSSQSATGIKYDPGAKDALVGSWAQAKEACNSGEAIRISADGTYGFEGEGGNWALNGEQLQFTNVKLFEMGVEGETDGDPSSVKVMAVGATSMKWQAPDGTVMDYVRCPGIN